MATYDNGEQSRSIACPKCDKSNPVNATYCMGCGAIIEPVAKPPKPPPAEAPPAPPEARRKALVKTLVILGLTFLGCVVLPILLIVISIASDNAKANKIDKLLAETSFTSSQEVKAFAAEYKIQYKEKSSGWDAKNPLLDDAVALLNNRYNELSHDEEEAAAELLQAKKVAATEQWLRDALADPPSDNDQYQKEIENRLDLVEDEELRVLCSAEIKRITPLAEMEREAAAEALALEREARAEERKAQALEAELLAQARDEARERKRKEPKPKQPGERSVDHNLAIIQNGGYVAADHDLVREAGWILDYLESKVNNTRTEIGDLSVSSWQVAEEAGVDINLFEFMYAAALGIPDEYENEDYAGIATAIALILIAQK